MDRPGLAFWLVPGFELKKITGIMQDRERDLYQENKSGLNGTGTGINIKSRN